MNANESPNNSFTGTDAAVPGIQCRRSYRGHLPHDRGFWEKHYFSQGDKGIRVFDTAVGKVTVQICYDQWFPEGARLAALQNAEILVYLTAIGMSI